MSDQTISVAISFLTLLTREQFDQLSSVIGSGVPQARLSFVLDGETPAPQIDIQRTNVRVDHCDHPLNFYAEPQFTPPAPLALAAGEVSSTYPVKLDFIQCTIPDCAICTSATPPTFDEKPAGRVLSDGSLCGIDDCQVCASDPGPSNLPGHLTDEELIASIWPTSVNTAPTDSAESAEPEEFDAEELLAEVDSSTLQLSCLVDNIDVTLDDMPDCALRAAASCEIELWFEQLATLERTSARLRELLT